jgi:hypothetical protein
LRHTLAGSILHRTLDFRRDPKAGYVSEGHTSNFKG